MKIQKYLSIQKYIWLILPVFAIILMLPFLNPELLIRGHDTELHLNRVVGFVEAVKSGQIPAKVYPNAVNGFGYGWGIFYPPLSVLVPGAFVLMGMDLDIAFKLFLWLTISFSGIFMYFLVMDISEKKEQSIVSALLYISCPYFLSDVIIRGAVGEILVFVFLPVLFRGFFNLLYADRGKAFWIAIGFAGLAYSHVIGLALSIMVSAVFLLFHLRRIFSWDVFKRLVIWSLVAVILSAGFLVPLAEHMLFHDYNIEHLTDNELTYQMAAYPSQIFATEIVFNMSSQLGKFEEMPFTLGLISLGLLVSGLLVFSSLVNHRLAWFYLSLLFLFGITVYMSTVLFPWRQAGALAFIQFPWRFLIFSAFFISLLNGWIFSELNRNQIQPVAIAFLSLVSLLTVAPLLDIYIHEDLYFEPQYGDYRYHNFMEDDGFIYNVTFMGGAREYFPTGVDEAFLRERGDGVTVLRGDAQVSEFLRNGNQLSFSFTNGESSELELPLIYYAGYQVEVTETNGKKELLLPYESPNHLVSVNLEGIRGGDAKVYYRGTLAGRIAFYVSLLGWLAFMGVGFSGKRLKKKFLIA